MAKTERKRPDRFKEKSDCGCCPAMKQEKSGEASKSTSRALSGNEGTMADEEGTRIIYRSGAGYLRGFCTCILGS